VDACVGVATGRGVVVTVAGGGDGVRMASTAIGVLHAVHHQSTTTQ
jgi:hypothetical protein